MKLELKDYLWMIGLSLGAALLILTISDFEMLQAVACYLCVVLVGVLYTQFKTRDTWL